MPRTNYRQFRFSNQELTAYEALANAAGVSLSEWVRNTLNVEVVVNRKILPVVVRASLKDSMRELSLAELDCPVRGCCLGSNHEGPCMPGIGDEETPEMYVQNLLVLSRDDPEGFKNKMRELLREKGVRKCGHL